VIVVDTSVALQWLLVEPDAEKAEDLIARDDLAAPDIILLEAANVLSKKVRLQQIATEQAGEGLRFLRANIPTLLPSDTVVDRAFEISLEISHPVYDCMFLACAERLEARLLTRDAPFSRRADERGYGHLLAESGS
jgi:predicted nucleic acid-binding protein